MSGLMSFFFFVFLLPAAEVADELLVPELDRDRNSKLWQTPQTIQPKLEDWNKQKWHKVNHLGGDSQNFLRKFLIFFVTLGLKILRLFWLKFLFEADIIKGWC